LLGVANGTMPTPATRTRSVISTPYYQIFT
jgi:hypothetical protein